ncbi:hypothetical protein HDU84_005655 [Entophlyctis sp. JEL0112]|nr:hypothetical protein HDU84_005655 [Entophlyctis sp. JEL0112]
MIALLFKPSRAPDARQVYGLDHAMLNLELNSLWLNMGLWTNRTHSFADACENLARKVAGNSIGMTVMDFGSGCGDQLLLWKKLQPNCIIQTVTAERVQAELSASRVARSMLKGISVCVGNALQPEDWVPVSGQKTFSVFPDGSVDTIISLDACYHFHTRSSFLQLSASKLKPKVGILCLSDIILGPGAYSGQFTLIDQLLLRLFCAAAGVPMVNLVRMSDYVKCLEDCGFTNAVVEDVTEDVFGPFANYIRGRTNGIGTDSVEPGILNSWRWIQFIVVGWFLEWAVARKALLFVVTRAYGRG